MASPWNNQTVKIQNRTISWEDRHVAMTIAAIACNMYMYIYLFRKSLLKFNKSQIILFNNVHNNNSPRYWNYMFPQLFV